MGLLLAMLAAAWADPWSDDEATRFGGAAPEPAPTVDEAPQTWRGGARAELRDLVAVEARLHRLGADPAQVVLVSAHLDWGTRIGGAAGGDLRFARTGLTVQSQRLSDGAVLHEGRVVDEDRVYDLSDPKERARLCTRAKAGKLGSLTLHTWTGASPTEGELPGDASFLIADAAGGPGTDRTALVALQPGESATLVEVVGDDGRRLRVRRAMTVQRGEQVMHLAEGDVQQRICLDF